MTGWAYIPNSDGDQESPPTPAQVEMLPEIPDLSSHSAAVETARLRPVAPRPRTGPLAFFQPQEQGD